MILEMKSFLPNPAFDEICLQNPADADEASQSDPAANAQKPRRPDRQVYVPRGRRDKPSSLAAHSASSLQHSPNSTGSETESPRPCDSTKTITTKLGKSLDLSKIPSTSAESVKGTHVAELADHIKRLEVAKDSHSCKDSMQISPQSSTSVISSADSTAINQSSDPNPVSSNDTKIINERTKSESSDRPKSAPVQGIRSDARKLQMLDKPILIEPCTKSDSEQSVPAMNESDEARAVRRAAKEARRIRRMAKLAADGEAGANDAPTDQNQKLPSEPQKPNLPQQKTSDRESGDKAKRKSRAVTEPPKTSADKPTTKPKAADAAKATKHADKPKDKDRTMAVNPETDDWESMFDETGECVDPALIDDITAAVGKVAVSKPKSEYKEYQEVYRLDDEEFPHVLEVSSFPSEFRTNDIFMIFDEYKESGFDVKWVDDTHALIVFSSSKVAAQVLNQTYAFVKLKPLKHATPESRAKAKKSAVYLQPYRQRPETCAALARRLVTGALGVRLSTAKEEREAEREQLKRAKERKLLAAKQRDEAWEND